MCGFLERSSRGRAVPALGVWSTRSEDPVRSVKLMKFVRLVGC